MVKYTVDSSNNTISTMWRKDKSMNVSTYAAYRQIIKAEQAEREKERQSQTQRFVRRHRLPQAPIADKEEVKKTTK